MSDTPKCPHCGSAVSSVSGARIFFKCGSYSTTPTNDYTSDLCDALRELNAANERIKQLEQPITGETSDGYHTFNELYEHRYALFLAIGTTLELCSMAWMSRRHDDGSEMEGWFIAGIHLPTGDVSYHLPLRMWDSFRESGFMVLPNAPKWDGHTSKNVVERLMKYAAE